MAANASRNRISTDMNHNLVILEIRDEDVGLYFCHGPLGEATEQKYNYLLDSKRFLYLKHFSKLISALPVLNQF